MTRTERCWLIAGGVLAGTMLYLLREANAGLAALALLLLCAAAMATKPENPDA